MRRGIMRSPVLPKPSSNGLNCAARDYIGVSCAAARASWPGSSSVLGARFLEDVAEHSAAVVDVGGQRSVAGGAARPDLGEPVAVEQVTVVHPLGAALESRPRSPVNAWIRGAPALLLLDERGGGCPSEQRAPRLRTHLASGGRDS